MLAHRLKTGLFVLLLAVAALPAFGQADTGSANFTRYIAFGDSITAGFQSGSLVRYSQLRSYPALIEIQVKGNLTGFELPLVSDPGIPAILELRSLSPLIIAPKAGAGQPQNLNLPRAYDNIAVPGANVHDLRFTTNGGLHDLILRNPAFGNTTALQQGLSRMPTFVTLWIGNNDALGAATTGSVAALTPLASFETDYRAAAAAIAATGAKMAIANVPNVTTLPFVNTLSRFLVNPATNQPVLVGGAPVPLIGPDGPLAAGDHVLLTAQAQLAVGRGIPTALGGTGVPLSDSVVLNAAETAAIADRINQYNAVIRDVASQVGAAFVDANALLNQAATTGINVGGVTFSAAFLTGGIFSYDGIHPTSFGYAFIANQFIDAINDKFGGSIPEVDLFPFLFGPTDIVAVPATGADSVPQLSPEASRNLFWSLGLKDPAEKPGKPAKPTRGRNRPTRWGKH